MQAGSPNSAGGASGESQLGDLAAVSGPELMSQAVELLLAMLHGTDPAVVTSFCEIHVRLFPHLTSSLRPCFACVREV